MTDNGAIPASVVVNVDDAACTRGKAGLDQLIIRTHSSRVEVTINIVVDEVLPADGESKDVEEVVLHEMVHLLSMVGRRANRRSVGTSLACVSLNSSTTILWRMEVSI